VLALLSQRSGESQQILGLAEALGRHLGWPHRVFRPTWTSGAPALGLARCVTAQGLSAASRAALLAEKADLVLTSSLRNEPIARWFAQSCGNSCRVIYLGRTWAGSGAFDLTVTTPQYRVKAHPRVMENPGTVHRLSNEVMAAARERWAPVFASQPRPRLGVLVGGDSGPFAFRARAASRLARSARMLAGDGSILATTSARTDPAARAVLAAALTGPSDWLWEWTADGENPYFGILAWCDALLVTGDSIAMVSEAVATGRPVRLFDPGGMHAAARLRDETLASRAYALLMRLGPERLSRDLGRVHARLVAEGQAAWDEVPLPEALCADRAPTIHSAYLDATVERIRSLVEAAPA
jgi:mitochondrial fission protein ELM1